MKIIILKLQYAPLRSYSMIMFIISGIINLYTAIFMKEQGIRIGTILTTICNIITFSMIGCYASIAGEVLRAQ